MSTKHEDIIIWQKWIDPFGEKEDELSDDFDNFYDSDSDDLDEEEEENLSSLMNQPKPIKVIATPMGIIPVNDNTASGKIFNFWIGHTNFNITAEISRIIEACDGVECLNVFTRYRFRIAIGKAFTDSVVMKEIQDTIYHYLENFHD
jgi:hypothetical protein